MLNSAQALFCKWMEKISANALPEGDQMHDKHLDVAIDYAKSMLGVPYVWGGNHPHSGLDCSGFVQEYLSALGLDPKGDQSSQMQFDHFMDHGTPLEHPQRGCLAFFGKNEDRISHVAICLNGMQMIEAGGAGRLSNSLEASKLYGGCVRIRPIKSRSDLVRFIDPF